MNFETIDTTTIVVPCSFEGEYRISLPTDDLNNGDFSSLSSEDFEVLLDGITPAERARLNQYELPIPIVESPEDHAIAEFMREREELKAEIALDDAVQALQSDMIDSYRAEMDMMHAGVQFVGEEFAKVQQELAAERVQIKKVEDLLIQSAYYHLSLRDQLATMGITVETNENGQPVLTVDLMELTNSVERAMGI